MGCDCTNYLPVGTNLLDVIEHMNLLGYQKTKQPTFLDTRSVSLYFWKNDNDKYFTGIESVVSVKNNGSVEVWTRTTVWRSRFDSEYHNYTIKQLKKRFGGYFISDKGKNRYFQNNTEPKREKAEGGCYFAFIHFENNISKIGLFLSSQPYDNKDYFPISNIDFMNSLNPKIISTNLVVPFLISILEDYFRSIYIALLKYSTKKSIILKNGKLSHIDLMAICDKELTVEEAFSQWCVPHPIVWTQL